MAVWSQSPFLQALGWAMLNSFWQMALLYAGVSMLHQLFRLSPHTKYNLAIGSLGLGLSWFIYTFFAFFNTGTAGFLLDQHRLAPSSQSWNLILSSASMAYLLLLLVPAYRLFKNWRYIEHLKKFGLQKTAMEYRLFVKTVAHRLGIRHTVHVFISNLVQSPLTIGYLKPIILLPVAAVNSLSPQQVEAVLLHELSHIRRYDYLINFIITLLQTLFYFNPFVRKIVQLLEFERENCCDELVLQFQYDKISYAAALLLLEKNLLASERLVLAAAGKKHLLTRIEKIVGLEKKTRFTFNQFTGLLASFLVVLFVNSLLFVNKEVTLGKGHSFAAFENPILAYETPPVAGTFSKSHAPAKTVVAQQQPVTTPKPAKEKGTVQTIAQPIQEPTPHLVPVAYDATDEMVTPAEKEHIEQTLETTKTVLTHTKWKEVERAIGDGMTANEKKAAKNEYLKAVNKIDWTQLENKLKSEYDELNWPEITIKLNSAITEMKLDSLKSTYECILNQIRKTETKAAVTGSALPLPDASLNQVNILKNQIQIRLDSIEVIRQRKVINF